MTPREIGFVAPPGDQVAALQARMARFSDGDDHPGRRRAVEDVLAAVDPRAARAAARRLVDEHLDEHLDEPSAPRRPST